MSPCLKIIEPFFGTVVTERLVGRAIADFIAHRCSWNCHDKGVIVFVGRLLADDILALQPDGQTYCLTTPLDGVCRRQCRYERVHETDEWGTFRVSA